MNKTKIEYADYSWNFFTGCVDRPIRPGCENCWARSGANRFKGRFGYPKDESFRPTIHSTQLNEPSKIKTPARILVNFMGDMFCYSDYLHVRALEHFISIANNSSHHTYILLTKFVDNAIELFKACRSELNQDNVWFGITCETQGIYEQDVKKLEQIPIANKWVSFEPMLSPISLNDEANKYFDWCVIGGESGRKAREVKFSWMLKLLLDCQKLQIPAFLKQFGNAFVDDINLSTFTPSIYPPRIDDFSRVLP